MRGARVVSRARRRRDRTVRSRRLILILLLTTIFGLLQGLLITSLRLPAIVVTIATFIGLQGVSLLLRPTAAGQIDDAISDAAQFPIGFLPAGLVLTLAMVAVRRMASVPHRLRPTASAPSARARWRAIGSASTAGA